MQDQTDPGWDMSSLPGPDHSPGFLLWQQFTRWQRGLNTELKPFGLTQPQFALLAVCGWLTRSGDRVSQRDIVNFLGMEKMHVSQIAARLDAMGLIERKSSDVDQRAKHVSLSNAGRAKLEETLSLVEAYDQAFFARESG